MFKQIALATVLASATALGTVAADARSPMVIQASSQSAQDVARAVGVQKVHHRERLGPHKIKRILRHYGYRDVNIYKVRSRSVIAIAHTRRGPVRLVVSRKTGRILEKTKLRRAGYSHRHGYKHRRSGATIELRFGL